MGMRPGPLISFVEESVASTFLADIRRVLDEHGSFLVAGHEDLDGDCLGSQLAIYHWLVDGGKKVVLVSTGPTLGNYAFLPGYDKVLPRVPDGFEAEVTVCLDTASAERVLPGVRLQGTVVNIDHHGGNSNFGHINWVDPSAAAVGQMVFALLDGFKRPLTRDIATCLYLAILTDTGSFHYSKTSARTFEVATALVHAGADPHAISAAYYDNVHAQTIGMIGEIFSHLHFELDGRLVWSEITRDMYERWGGLERQPEQLASQLRSIRGVEVAVLFHEVSATEGRASLRSRGEVDVNKAANELGGGGHPSAAGIRFQGEFAANRDKILEVLRRHVGALKT